MSRDIDFANGRNDFSRGFLGDDFRNADPTTGEVIGTSFAAPHVAGAAALLYEYSDDNFNLLEAANAIDHRTIKVNLLHGASAKSPGGAALKHQDNVTNWNQGTVPGTAPGPINPLQVNRSLDNELGAGLLDTYQSLKQFAAGQVDGPTILSAASPNNLDAEQFLADHDNRFWNLDSIDILDWFDFGLGDISGAHFRATLTWDDEGFGLSEFDLQLYRFGTDDFDPFLNPILIGETISTLAGENVKLLDFVVPDLGAQENAGFFLRVANNDTIGETTYALAVTVPEPGGAIIVILMIGVVSRRRSR
jgi:hypothetical protein